MTSDSPKKTSSDSSAAPYKSPYGDLGAYQISNPQEFAENMFRLAEESGKAMTQMWLHSPGQSGPMSPSHELVEASRTMTEIAGRWLQTRKSSPKPRPTSSRTTSTCGATPPGA